MITTVKLTHYLPYIFLCVMRSLEIYFLNVFQVFNTLLLTIVIMLYMRCPDLFILHNGNFLPFNQHLPISPTLPDPGTHCSTLCFYEFIFFFFLRFHLQVRSDSISLWFILLSIMSSRFIYVVANGRISFFFMAE